MDIINPVVDVSIERNVAIVTVDSPPVNALSAEVRRGLVNAFRQASADPEAQAILLICRGKTFIVGADISEIGKPLVGPSVREVQETLESISKPVVAAIHGTALGTGLEIALVADFRVAVPSAKAGWPEVNIGLLPGAGGTQRLPRIVGVERALDLLTTGRHISAKIAVAMGLFDELVDEGNLRDGAIAFAKRIIDEGVKATRLTDLNDKLEEARQRPEIFLEYRAENARRFRGFDAPEANIKAIEAAVNLSFEEGLDEGIAARASDIDTVWIKRYGWPLYRILAKMREFERRFGERLKPAALLEYLVSEGRGFMDEVINEAVLDES
jgi:3-hydroxyacyl-CoA dehydrogenase